MSGKGSIGKNIRLSDVIMANGKTVKRNLIEQAVYLQELINKHIKMYRKRFKPVEYQRTGRLENSVCISKVIENGGIPRIYVYFDDNAVNKQLYGDDTVNVALLINSGYSVKKPVWFRDIVNFGWRIGNRFIHDAIDEFNATNSIGMVISPSDLIIGQKEW